MELWADVELRRWHGNGAAGGGAVTLGFSLDLEDHSLVWVEDKEPGDGAGKVVFLRGCS